jgi:AmmeMemoRadiSam system protein B/AmmeMemoRadiSam system protein A
MKRTAFVLLVTVLAGMVLSSCRGQAVGKGKVKLPSRAGQFYPESREELRETIGNFLNDAQVVPVGGDVAGIWVPHAGYEFSGQVAANAFRIVRDKAVETVIVVAPSHYVALAGGSVGDWTAYRTPLGDAAVDTLLVRRIRSATPLVTFLPDAHVYEHADEVEIPFVQTVLPKARVVPMVVGQLSLDQARKIAKAIVWAAGKRPVLLVASSDMSHFPSYKDAYDVDLRVMDIVGSGDVAGVLGANTLFLRRKTPNLECALCGDGALAVVMLACQELGASEVKLLPYANSGDVSGERERVVGYGAAAFFRKTKASFQGEKTMTKDIAFSAEEKAKLFRIARETILAALKGERMPEFSVTEPGLLAKRGVFVTLTNHERLRGCIGHFGADYPLHQIVAEMARAAAVEDYRFAGDPVTVEEMKDIAIKISIISEMEKIKSVNQIEVGKHGIYVRQGNRGGTYLPEVAVDMGWDRTEFLEHCCLEKAGLPRDAWKKGAEIYIYSSQILDEE